MSTLISELRDVGIRSWKVRIYSKKGETVPRKPEMKNAEAVKSPPTTIRSSGLFRIPHLNIYEVEAAGLEKKDNVHAVTNLVKSG